MMNNWFHTILGKYNPTDKWMGIDYSKLLLDPLLAETTLMHETAHSIIAAQTDFGQFSFIMYRAFYDEFPYFSNEETKELEKLIYQMQLFVQEGIATFMEISWRRKLTDKRSALAWAKKELPIDYLQRFEKLLFAFELSQRYRDFFTSKVSQLAMDTGIRRLMVKEDLLSSADKILHFLQEEENSPDVRLEKIIDTLREKPWMTTKTLPEIARASNITWYEPTTKEEVVDFLNYVSSKTKNPHTFTIANVVDAPTGVDAVLDAKSKLIVGNMNLTFQPGEVIFKCQDFLFYASRMKFIFVSLEKQWKRAALIEQISGMKPEVMLVGFLSYGEKYMTAVSCEMATSLLNEQFRDKTVIVKWGGYDAIQDRFIWSTEARPPDIVLYNSPRHMLEKFKELILRKPETSFTYIYIGAGENHPLQTLLVRISGSNSIHMANDFGNKEMLEVIALIKEKSSIMTNNEFRANKQHINNGFHFGLGLHEDIDWVETMIDKETLIFRK